MRTNLAIYLIILLLFPVLAIGEIQTITHTVKQTFGGSQSPDDARISAMAKAKREALEKAGTYIESLTVVKNYQVDKDEILALAAGVLKAEVVSQKNYASEDAFGIDVVVKVVVDTSVLEERVKKLLQDRTHLTKLKDTQKREKELLQRVAQLEEENRKLSASNQSTQKLKEEFQKASEGLTVVDWVNKALSLWDGKKITDPHKAIEYWNNAIKLKPDDSTLYYNKGLAYRALDDHAQAIDCYNAFIHLNPIFAVPEAEVAAAFYTSRGFSYGMLGQYDRSISDYDEAIRLKPDRIETYGLRATTYSELGQYDRAIRDYSEVIRHEPDNAPAYEYRGDAYASHGQKKQAIEDYKEAIRLDQNNAHIYVKRALLYFDLRQLDQAIQDCNVAIRLKPDYAEAYAVRGYAYGLSFSLDGLSGNLKESCASFEKACALGAACDALFQSKKKGLCR